MIWKELAISNFSETGSGTTPSRREESRYYGGAIPWVKSGELREEIIQSTSETVTDAALKETSLKLVPAGAVLVAMYGATVGRVGMLGIAATTNQAVCHIIPDPAIVDAHYLFQALRAKIGEFLARASGGAQPNISQKIVRETRIPIPPLPEQRRIAAILDKAEALRAKRRRACTVLLELEKSCFLDAVKQVTPQTFSVSDLLSNGYLTLHKDGNHGGLYPRAEEFGIEGIPFLSAKSINDDGEIDDCSVQRLSDPCARRLRIGWLQSGDILLAHNASVGKVALYAGQYPEALIGTSLTAFRPNPKLLDCRFFAAALRADAFQLQLAKNMGQTTRNQVPITAQRPLTVAIPLLSIQKEFSKRSLAIQSTRSRATQMLKRFDLLFASLQHRAFRGEL